MQKKLKKSIQIITIITISLALLFAENGFAAQVGDEVKNIKLNSTIPDFGVKLLSIFYVDPDIEPDTTDPVADAIKAKKFPKEKYKGMGIVNMKDAPWKPDIIIEKLVDKKRKKYNSIILTDDSLKLSKKWKLGNCNDKAVILIIGKDKKIKYFKKIKSKSESRKIIPEVLNIISSEIGK